MKGHVKFVSAADAVKKSSMQRDAFLLLKQMIDQGRILPGEKLLEVQVAKAFGISRSPARHALQALCEAKIVRALDGRGYQVAGRSKAEHTGKLASLTESKISLLPQWERVYRSVEQELWTRILFESVRITEVALADFFGVSRTVARDVLARLHSVGVVSKDDLGRWFAPQVTAATIQHLFELRAVLEPETLLRAVPFIPKRLIEELYHRLNGAIHGPNEMGLIGQIETDLHVTLLDYCPNREMTKTLSQTHILFVPMLYLLDPNLTVPEGTTNAALQEHLAIIEKLRSKKSRSAARLLRGHIEVAAARWLERFESFSKAEALPLPPYLSSLRKPALRSRRNGRNTRATSYVNRPLVLRSM
jgi:DNA-binding GntR family transcriptional regulator